MKSLLFQNKTKNNLCVIFSAIYALSILEDRFLLHIIANVEGIAGLLYVLNSLFIKILDIAAPICLIIYILTINKEYKLKKWLVPFGFALRAVTAFMLAFNSTELLLSDFVISIVFYILVCIQGLAVIATFIGTLYDFEYSILIKWGSAAFVVAVVVSEALKIILYGGALSVVWELIDKLCIILFYIGLFIITTNKANKNEE